MTGTKQLLGHFYRLLDLLWQMLNRGRPTPTNSNEKNPLPGSITGSQAFEYERIPPSIRSLNSLILNRQMGLDPQPPSSERSSSNVVLDRTVAAIVSDQSEQNLLTAYSCTRHAPPAKIFIGNRIQYGAYPFGVELFDPERI